MAKKIVECVPNFSEGQDEKIIRQIAESINEINGVKLLDVDPDKDYNRVVITFVGEPSAVKIAAYEATKTASELIDMTKHKGEHPRIGATDVIPFVPISEVTMEDCIKLANEIGKEIGEILKIPVYLYASAAKFPERVKLPDIRKGEYEGLQEKLKDPKWKPDYGPIEFNAKSGATVVGARFFLIAYNINLNTPDVKIADEISARVRESGRVMKNEKGETLKDKDGKTIKIPGTLKATQAKGVLLESYNIAQVSMNLLNFEIISIHHAFEEVKKHAKELGVEVTGSEIVGLTPLKPLQMAGKFYTEKQNIKNADDRTLLNIAIENLGLSQFEKFELEKKVIEYII
jgi:glutamate formiminotransferase/formiminotetrahydrofolate cyclodeaminase